MRTHQVLIRIAEELDDSLKVVTCGIITNERHVLRRRNLKQFDLEVLL